MTTAKTHHLKANFIKQNRIEIIEFFSDFLQNTVSLAIIHFYKIKIISIVSKVSQIK